MSRKPALDTRSDLLARARTLFAERGFAGTATEEIVASAGITPGALYYHFADKMDLFRAVFEELQGEVVARIDAAAAAAKGRGAPLRAACHAWLDACLDPAVQRVVLLDGPTVLGWEECRRIDARYGTRSLRNCLEAAMAQGAVPRQPAAPLARILAGALDVAALEIALAADRRAARRSVGRAIDTLLDGLQRMALR
jgi:AcrR family transcriptional regulator